MKRTNDSNWLLTQGVLIGVALTCVVIAVIGAIANIIW